MKLQAKWTPLRGNCPVCLGLRHDCRKHEFTGQIHCRADVEPPLGWFFIKHSEIGFGIYSNQETDRNADRETYRQKWQKQKKAEQHQLRTAPPLPQRDKEYRSIARRRGLTTRHREELQRRGLSDEQIDWMHARGIVWTWDGGKLDGISANLPGAAGQNKLRNFKGLAIAAPSLEGQIAGCQIRPHNGGYFWVSSAKFGGHSPKLSNGENPIGVYHPMGEPIGQHLWFAEGLLKPQIAALRLNEIVIGAAGGLFSSSPEQIKTVIAAFPNRALVLAADGGAVANKNVMRAYQKLHRLVSDMNRELVVAWWGQITKADSDSDIDEITDFDSIQFISWSEFEAIAIEHGGLKPTDDQLLDRILKLFQRKTKQKQPAKPLFTAKQIDIVHSPGSRLTTWQQAKEKGYQSVLAADGTGAGKSFDAGQINPAQLGLSRAIYASDQHRNPTTETLTKDNGWVDLEARHNGLTREATVDGHSRLRRSKPGEDYSVAPNCNRVKLINTLRAKHVSGADTAAIVCGGCPVRERCCHTEGRGYGFLKARREALTSPKLRAHPDSLPSPTEFNYSDTVVIWDEPGQIFRYHQTIQVSVHDIQQVTVQLAISHPDLLARLQPLLKTLVTLVTGNLKRFGLNHDHVTSQLKQLSNVDLLQLETALQPNLEFLNTTAEYGADLADLPPNIRRKFAASDAEAAAEAAEAVANQWLPNLLRILNGQQTGQIAVGFSPAQGRKQHCLTIWQPDYRYQQIAQAAGFNIFLDATLSREQLALMLGCKPNQILVTAQDSSPTTNLDIVQVSDLGHMGMQRGADQKQRANAIADYYRNLDPTTKVIDFKKENSDGAWWRDSRGVNHFLDVKTLVLIGTPCQNLMDLSGRYAILTGSVPDLNDENFQRFVAETIDAEYLQAIGRLRANRRGGEALRVVILSDFELSISTRHLAARDITIKAASKVERKIHEIRIAVQRLLESGQRVTQQAVGQVVCLAQSTISESVQYRQAISVFLLNPFNRKTDNPELDAVATVVDTAISDCETISEINSVVQDVFGGWLPQSDWSSLTDCLKSETRIQMFEAFLANLPVEKLRILENRLNFGVP